MPAYSIAGNVPVAHSWYFTGLCRSRRCARACRQALIVKAAYLPVRQSQHFGQDLVRMFTQARRAAWRTTLDSVEKDRSGGCRIGVAAGMLNREELGIGRGDRPSRANGVA